MARKQIRILYIDDYPLDRALVRDALLESDLDIQISEAANQQEFFELLSEDFDLVLSDFNILGFTGLEVLEAVQEISTYLPVIIVTGTGSEEIAAEAIKRGAADYVIKSPQHIHRLPFTIQSVLEKAQLKEEQRRAYQELVESEARYSQLIDTLQEGIWTIDDQGITTFVNPALAEMLGYKVEEMLGKHLFDFMDQKGKELAQQSLEKRQQGESEKHDFVFLHKDGRKVNANLVTSPIIDREGGYQGAVAALRDISKEVEAEKALYDSRLELQTLVDNTPGSIWTLDRNYRLISGNSKFLNDLEKAFQKPIKKGYALLANIDREDKREWKGYYDRSFKGEKFQIERQRRHGEEGSWFEYFFSPIRGERGEIRGVMVQALDITDRKLAEFSQAESTEKYRKLVDQLGSALFLHDMEGNLVEVNQQAIDFYGYSKEELLSLDAGDIDPDYDDRAQGGKFWENLFQQAPQQLKARHKREDGTFFPVEVSLNPITLKGEDYILALASDISDRQEAERELAESESKYRTLTEKSPAAIYETDAEGSCFYINAKWQEISGLSNQEASKYGWVAGIHPGDRDRILSAWKQFIRTGTDWKQEYRFQDKTGKITWVQGEAVPLLDEQGKIRGYLGTNTIINDRKELENQLLETNRTLDALLANLPGMAFRCRNNPDWDMLFVSHGAQELCGYSPEELTDGRATSFGDLIHPTDQKRVWDSIQQAFTEDRPYQIRYRILRRDGVERWVQEQGVATRIDREGNVIELDGFSQDITEQIQAARELESTVETFSTVLDSIDAHIYVSDLDTYEVLFMNQKMIQDFEGNLLGKKCYQAFRGKEKPCQDCRVTQLTDVKGNPSSSHSWESRNEITGRWYLNTDRAIPWTDRPLAHIQIAIDIHDRKLAEQSLKESEERFRSSFENTQVGMALIDRQGQFLSVNQAVCAILNYSEGELLGKTYLEITHPDSVERSANLFQSSLEDRQPYNLEKKYLTRRGETIISLTSVSPVFSDQGEFLYAVAHLIDITQEKLVEEEIRAQQEFYNQILRSVQDGIWVTNHNDRLIYVNPAMEGIAGVDAEQMLGLSVIEDFPPETTEHFLPQYREVRQTGSPMQYEAPVVTPAGRETFQAGWLIPRNENDAYQGMICTIQDVTEQRKNARELEESEEKFRNLFENMLDGFNLCEIVLDQDGKPVDYIFLEVNSAYEELTGLERSKSIGRKVTEVLPGIEADPANWIQIYGQVALTGKDIRFEQYSQPLDRWYSVVAYSPAPEQFAVVFEDITERKEFEQKLHESEQLYRQLYQSSGVGVGYYTPDGEVISFNEIALGHMNLELDQVVGKSIRELFPKKQAEEYLERIQQVLATEGQIEFEDQIELAGGLKWFLSILSVIKDPHGEPLGVQILSLDITERKQLEETLMMSDFIINSTSDSIIVTNPEGRITFWNPGAEEIYGYSAEEMLGQPVSSIYREEDYQELEQTITDLISGKNPGTVEVTNLTRDQQEIEVLLTLSTIQNSEGKVTELVGITKDITSLRVAEQSLLLEKQRTQQYLDVAEIMLMALDTQQRVQAINPKGCEILGYPEEDILGKNWFDHFLDPGEIDRVKEVYDQQIDGDLALTEYFENYIVRADGTRRLIAWHNSSLENEEGKTIGVFSSGEDITERRAAEIELQKSKETAERYLNIAAEIILSLDREGTITLLNPSGHRLLGYQPGELIGKKWLEVCLPKEDAQLSQNILSEMLAGETSKYDVVEGRVLTKQGELKDILWHNSLLRDQQGRATGTLSSGEDITRLIEIRDELSYSRQLLINLSQAARQVQNLLEETKIYQTIGEEIAGLGFNIAIFILSEDETALELKYVSYQKGILNQVSKIAGILPAEYQIALKPDSYFSQQLENNQTRLDIVTDQVLTQALPGIGKNILKRIVPLLDLDKVINAPLVIEKEVFGLLVVMGSEVSDEDVAPIALFANQASTALRNARFAEALRQRTEELESLTTLISETEEAERKRLSRELHDQVGQSLALLGFNLNQVKDQLEKNAELDMEKIENAQGILQEVTSGIRSVMDDLRPAILDDYGLLPALHWYTDKISEHSGLQIEVVGESLSPRLEKRKEVALFRITQEALTNITRHAQAALVELELSENQNLVTLTIADDGIGFDLLNIRDQENQAGWGLINMQERALRMGGKLKIVTKENKGTKLIIQVPRE